MELRDINFIRYKRGIFSVNDCFLNAEKNEAADINYFIQVPDNYKNALNEFYTLLIDLSLSKEEIFQEIYHRTRDEINSFIINQKFEHKVMSALSEPELKVFIRLYNEFAKTKGLKKLEEYRILNYNREKILAVSYIRQGEDFLAINFYRATRQRASNLYTFSLKYKYENKYSASHLGRAHRALHWLDIDYFKESRAGYYDFCGWYNGIDDVALLNINKFKEQFAGNKIKEFSGVIYCNLFIKLLKKIF